jgi:hypothetical protein
VTDACSVIPAPMHRGQPGKVLILFAPFTPTLTLPRKRGRKSERLPPHVEKGYGADCNRVIAATTLNLLPRPNGFVAYLLQSVPVGIQKFHLKSAHPSHISEGHLYDSLQIISPIKSPRHGVYGNGNSHR